MVRHRALTSAALLLIDVINPFDFERAAQLYERALPAARRVHLLRRRARRRRLPIIYVNDNFGHWRSDFRETVRQALVHGYDKGRIARLLRPSQADYFVLKPRHSGFYLTPLELLLHALDVETVILTGFATDICVLYTAADAHMRGFRLVVPRDCVAAEDDTLHRFALAEMERVCKADTRPSDALTFAAVGARRSHSQPPRSPRRVARDAFRRAVG
jgi:nicotinamidase-related amidase